MHWSVEVYKQELQLKEDWDEDGDDPFEAKPQWGFMKGLIENDFVLPEKEEEVFWWAAIKSLFA